VTEELLCPCDLITTMDCVAGMKAVRGRANLIFADPPFNIDFDYDIYQDKKPYAEYLSWTESWMAAAYHALAPNGSFFVSIGDEFAAELKLAAMKVGFHPRNWIVWYYTFGVNCTNKFTRSHCHLLHFVKDDKNFVFRADDPINRVPSARQLKYNDKRANPKGRLPDDTWILMPEDVPDGFSQDGDVWHFPRVCGTFKERQGWHGCQMPEALMRRIISFCSNPGDLVLDPFCGSGTTASEAKRLCRRYLSFDISTEYVCNAIARVNRVEPDPKHIPATGDIRITLKDEQWKSVAACCKWVSEFGGGTDGEKAFAGAVAAFLEGMLANAEKLKDAWPSIQKDRDKLMQLVAILTAHRIHQSRPDAWAAGWKIANQLAVMSPAQKEHRADVDKQHPAAPGETPVAEEPTAEEAAAARET
jgi:DNA modification methylase